jgi:hypothetical protein
VLIDVLAYPPKGIGPNPYPYPATARIGGWKKSLQVNMPATWSRWRGAVVDDTAERGPVPLRFRNRLAARTIP